MHKSSLSCCEGLELLDFSKMEVPSLLVLWSDPNLWYAAIVIILYPVYWILMAQLEYRTRVFSWMMLSRHVAFMVVAVTFIAFSLHRDWRFMVAMRSEPHSLALQENWILWIGHSLAVIGLVLVLSSLLVLGFYGTFCGDYFGILLPWRVTIFPYSHLDHPMYVGATFIFLGTALVNASPAGVVLSLLIAFMYTLAALIEGPFTELLYSDQLKRRSVGVQVSHLSATIEVPARNVGVQVDQLQHTSEKEKDS